MKWTAAETYERIAYLGANPSLVFQYTPYNLFLEFSRMTVLTRFYYLRELSNICNFDRCVYKLGPSTSRNRQVYWLIKRGAAIRVDPPRFHRDNPAIYKHFLYTVMGQETIQLVNANWPTWWQEGEMAHQDHTIHRRIYGTAKK